jgi:hypothetical protein
LQYCGDDHGSPDYPCEDDRDSGFFDETMNKNHERGEKRGVLSTGRSDDLDTEDADADATDDDDDEG